MYVGSADMMTRNLNGRIEVLAPVLDPDIRDNILEQIVKAQLADNVHAWVLAGDGTYTKVVPEKGAAPYDSQAEVGRHLHLLAQHDGKRRVSIS